MLKKILNFFLVFFLFVLIFMIIMLINNRNLIEKNNLANYISKGDILNVKANYILNIEDEEITLIDQLKKIFIDCNIPIDITNDLIESYELKQLLGEFFSTILSATKVNSIEEQTINKMINLAISSNESHLNITMTNEELTDNIIRLTEKIQNEIKNEIIFINNEFYSKIWIMSLNYNYDYLYVLVILISITIMIVNKSNYIILKYIGIILIITGFINVLIGTNNVIKVDNIIKYLDGVEILLTPLVINLLTLCFQSGFFLTASGCFLVIIYSLIIRIKLSNRIFNI